MKKQTLIAGAMLAQFAVAGIAAADVVNGPYVAADVGVSWLSDQNYDFDSYGSHLADFDRGHAWGIAAGWGFGNGWRAELELSHRNNDTNTFNDYSGAGRITATGGFVNAIYDFDIKSAVTPYIGAGVGYLNVSADTIRHTDNDPGCCSGIVDGSDQVLGLQAILGVSFALSPSVDLMLDYRYLLTQDPSFNYRTACDSDGTGCDTSGTTDANFKSRTLNIGIRWRF
ncbi:MAG: outer membrane beta-barrel protein [Hydrogenophilaceae bacterium]